MGLRLIFCSWVFQTTWRSMKNVHCNQSVTNLAFCCRILGWRIIVYQHLPKRFECQGSCNREWWNCVDTNAMLTKLSWCTMNSSNDSCLANGIRSSCHPSQHACNARCTYNHSLFCWNHCFCCILQA